MASSEKLAEKVRAHAEISERLGLSEVVSTKATNELSEKEKIIQEQAKLKK